MFGDRGIIDLTVRISPGFFLSLAVGLLVFPIPWLLAWLTAATIHELCHLLALGLLKCPVYEIRIGAFGTKIYGQIPMGLKGFICALSGPIGGLMLIPLLRIAPRLVLCALFQSVYNLIPIYPLDGGRALMAVLYRLFGIRIGKRVMKGIELFVILGMSVCIIKLAGVIGFLLPFIFVVRYFIFRKMKCQENRIAV